MQFRIIKGDKIRKQRGGRSLREVAEASGFAFTFGSLDQWERGECRPRIENVPHLLKALECDYEAISEPMTETVTA